MHDDDFEKIFEHLKGESFKEQKLDYLRSLPEHSHFDGKQIAEILKELTFVDAQKDALKIFKKMHLETLHVDDIEHVLEAVNFTEVKMKALKRLKRHIANRKNGEVQDKICDLLTFQSEKDKAREILQKD